MRSIKAKLGNEDVTLAATWEASLEIAEQVADPLFIVNEAAKESNGGYEPKFRFTVQNVAKILHIGAKAGGSDLSYKQVGSRIFDMGFLVAQSLAAEYLVAMVVASSDEMDGSGEGKP